MSKTIEQEVKELSKVIEDQYLSEFNHHDALKLADSLIKLGYRKPPVVEAGEGVKSLIRQLRLSNEALKEHLELCGSCDHTINHCVCELVHLIEDNDKAIKQKGLL